MNRFHTAAAALALAVGATACSRPSEHNEPTGAAPPPPATSEAVGTTETTGANVDKPEAQGAAEKAQRDTDLAQQSALADAKQQGKAECEEATAQQKADDADKKAKAAADKKAKAAKAKAKPNATETDQPSNDQLIFRIYQIDDDVGTTTTTGADTMGTVPPGTPAPIPDRDTSTTLGDGTSGMYTGGAGTYGGKATWGTGSPTPPPKR